MRSNKEYQLYKQIAAYLRYRYKDVYYHFDQAGLNLSKAQAGQMKAIQHSKGYPDLIVFHPDKKPLLLEIKPEGTKLYNKLGLPATPHIGEQLDCLAELRQHGCCAEFAVGWDEAKNLIDDYLNL